MALELDRSGFESPGKVYNPCKPHLPPSVGINLDAESTLVESMA